LFSISLNLLYYKKWYDFVIEVFADE
jgi:hypothetical protein